MDFSPDYLILMLTDACNLECAYCYLGNHKSTHTMAPHTIDRAMDLALASGTPFHVQLSGGEPTLAPRAVFHAAKKVRTLSPDSTLGIQTNATCIDNAMADMMLDFHMDVGVSLDGPPQIQEKLRGKAKKTFLGLQYLEDRQIPFTVTTVVTRENVSHLHALVMVLGGFAQARGLGLDLLVNKGNAKNHLVPDPCELEQGITKMMTALDGVNRLRPIPLQLRELNRLTSSARGRDNCHFCHAAVNKSLAVTPEGGLYPCTQTAFDPDFFWGTLENPHFMDAPASLSGLKRAGNFDPEYCGACPLKGRCPGDCPGRIYYNGNAALACVMYKTLYGCFFV
ncbi:uncharacterized protein SAMN02746065_101295 [Desulfocicer vacuolatum DSM 3385]|uniref:Radical SAM core domain-containing protein n=1 Tax=Desulfocicer vacuolatum DSM 3385 TaxID=1121400 RepID=A0A1W1YRV5_9BACT|nr:radical SAM protein [Desulfocicer vacuolatum]SMC38889.1 uncharacterized protein SAMN02746065_101295 [Desulfocicer vacuolatum DSM 3385]